MVALTVKEPWGSLIIHHGKDVENRTWSAPLNMRGQRIAIHTSARLDRTEFVSAVEHCYFNGLPNFDLKPADTVNGKIIGTVQLVDCLTWIRSHWFSGPVGWLLANPIALPRPIPAKGALGLWQLTPEIEAEVYRQVAEIKEKLNGY